MLNPVLLLVPMAVLAGAGLLPAVDAADCFGEPLANQFKGNHPGADDECWQDRNIRTLTSETAKLLIYDGINGIEAALQCTGERNGIMSGAGTMITDTAIGKLLNDGCGYVHPDFADHDSLTHSEIAREFKRLKPGFTETYEFTEYTPIYEITSPDERQVLTVTRHGGQVHAKFECRDTDFMTEDTANLMRLIKEVNCTGTPVPERQPAAGQRPQLADVVSGNARHHPAVAAFHDAYPDHIEDVIHTVQNGYTYVVHTGGFERILEIDYQGAEVTATRYTCTDHDGNRGTHHAGLAPMIRTGDCGGWKHVEHPQNLLPKQVGYPAASPHDHAWRAVWGSYHVAAFKAVSGPFTDGMEYRHGSPVYVIRDKAGSMVLELRTQGGTHGTTLTCTATGKVIRGDIFEDILSGPCPPANGGDNRPTPSSFGGDQGPGRYAGYRLSVAQEHPAAIAFMETVPDYDEETVETFPGESTYAISAADGSKVLEIDYSGPDVVGIRYTCTDVNGMAQSFDTGVASMIRRGWCDGPVDTKSGGGTKAPYTEPSGGRPNKFSGLYAGALDAFRTANPGSTENSDETSYDFYEFTATSRDQSKRLLIKYYDTSDGILYESISYTCTDNQGIEWTTKIGIISMIEAPSCSGEVGTRPDGSVPEKIPLHIPDGVPVHQAAMITDPIRAFTATIGDYTVEDRVLDYDHHLLVYKDVGSDAMLETEVILNEIIGWTYTCADGQSTTQSDGPAMAAMILDGRCGSTESTFFSGFIKMIGSLFATEPVRFEPITT